ncbi:MAG: type 3 dihydrofolate reductase [Deltaproteobacteria bacterium]|nr:type 3 dihydrofolate reductase [Deltaproteobacteria bacterium]
MIISLIAAMSENRVIGIDNRLPWRLPADMKWFKEKTMGKPIIMGRKTFESFGAKPLPGRQNVVITGNPAYRAEGAVVVHSVDEALNAAEPKDEIMIIGGASFYGQMLSRANRFYLTIIHENFEGDANFPPFDRDKWTQVFCEDHEADEKNPYPYSFFILER